MCFSWCFDGFKVFLLSGLNQCFAGLRVLLLSRFTERIELWRHSAAILSVFKIFENIKFSKVCRNQTMHSRNLILKVFER